MKKLPSIPCDCVIIDLEDGVGATSKKEAREAVCEALAGGDFGDREVVVRINGLDTPWGQDDLEAVARLRPDGIVLPKVETSEQVRAVAHRVKSVATTSIPLWAMIETPLGVLRAPTIAETAPYLSVLVVGTSDLTADLRARHTPNRESVAYALQRVVLAARAFRKDVLDGVHLNLSDDVGFERACVQGRDYGFDGKTLIHPKTVATANRVFGPLDAEVEHARRVVAAFEEATRSGQGVAVLDGQLIENLHKADAERTLARHAAASKRDGTT